MGEDPLLVHYLSDDGETLHVSRAQVNQPEGKVVLSIKRGLIPPDSTCSEGSASFQLFGPDIAREMLLTVVVQTTFFKLLCRNRSERALVVVLCCVRELTKHSKVYRIIELT